MSLNVNVNMNDTINAFIEQKESLEWLSDGGVIAFTVTGKVRDKWNEICYSLAIDEHIHDSMIYHVIQVRLSCPNSKLFVHKYEQKEDGTKLSKENFDSGGCFIDSEDEVLTIIEDLHSVCLQLELFDIVVL